MTGEPLTQREDDRPEVVRKRLLDYQAMTTPLLAHYRADPSSSIQVAEFSGSQSDLIYPQVKAFLDPLLSPLVQRKS